MKKLYKKRLKLKNQELAAVHERNVLAEVRRLTQTRGRDGREGEREVDVERGQRQTETQGYRRTDNDSQHSVLTLRLCDAISFCRCQMNSKFVTNLKYAFHDLPCTSRHLP